VATSNSLANGVGTPLVFLRFVTLALGFQRHCEVIEGMGNAQVARAERLFLGSQRTAQVLLGLRIALLFQPYRK